MQAACPSLGPAASARVAAKVASKPPPPEYLRIQVSPTSNVYVEFRGKEMRVATRAGDLESAKPVRAKKTTGARPAGSPTSTAFPDIVLPVANDELPPRYVNALAGFVASHYREKGEEGEEWSYVEAKLGLSRRDGKGVLWTYWITEAPEPEKAPVSAPVITLPKLLKPTLEVTTQREGKRRVGVAIVAKSGEVELSDITRSGKSVRAQLKILDRNNKAVVSESGPLSKYGFG